MSALNQQELRVIENIGNNLNEISKTLKESTRHNEMKLRTESNFQSKILEEMKILSTSIKSISEDFKEMKKTLNTISSTISTHK